MLGQLVVTAGPDKDSSFALEEGQSFVIGRGQESDTKLKDPQVSRKHCEVRVEDGKVLLINLSSSAATLVNGKRVTEHQLKPGDVVQLGSTHMRFLVDVDPSAPTLFEAPAAQTAPEKLEQLQDLVGKNLAHFEIQSLVAKGHSGLIFRAKDTEDGKVVALKVMLPEFSQNEEERQRFVRAMKTMMPLRHPNLVAILGAGKTGNYCWIAMELVEGESLSQVIQRIGTAGMLDWQNAHRVAVHIGRALEFAQQQHIVHRNLTPQNILIQKSDKTAKLGDLMLAKALEGNMALEITKPGEILGDVRYLPPERTRRDVEIDGRSDIYSLGAMVYHLLTGRPPCDGGSLPETIKKIRQDEPVKPKKFQLSIPDLFEGVVMKMLAKRPEDRYQNPTDMLAELEKVGKYQGLNP